MKTNLLSLCVILALACCKVYAQPTLTASGINPVVGDQLIPSGFVGTVTPGHAGANQTWDFSALGVGGAAGSTMIDASTTPYAAAFPDANLAINVVANYYFYYKVTSFAYQNYGKAHLNTDKEYIDPLDNLRYPFTYGDSYTDNGAMPPGISGGDTVYQSGSITVSADGYGTLKTPAGTYNNVLRVHRITSFKDSSFTAGNWASNYTFTYEYAWYINGFHFPLAEIDSFGGIWGGDFASTVTGIGEQINPANGHRLFPNPCNNYLNLEDLGGNEKVTIIVRNMLGQLIDVPITSFRAKATNYVMDISALTKGIYNLDIIGEKRTWIERFVKE